MTRNQDSNLLQLTGFTGELRLLSLLASIRLPGYCSIYGIRTRIPLLLPHTMLQGRYPEVVFIPTYAKMLTNCRPL